MTGSVPVDPIHEINNLLAVMIGRVDLLKVQASDSISRDELVSELDKIQAGARQVGLLVGHLKRPETA